MTNMPTPEYDSRSALWNIPTSPPLLSPDEIQYPKHLNEVTLVSALQRHLGNPSTTLVLCNMPLALSLNANTPDNYHDPFLMVSYNASPSLVDAHKGYVINKQGKPPDFVLDFADSRTTRNEYAKRRMDYARYGIDEYWIFDVTGGAYQEQWLFDPTGGAYSSVPFIGEWLLEPLVGELGDAEYDPVYINRINHWLHKGFSPQLGLVIYWDRGRLRFQDLSDFTFLATHIDDIAPEDDEPARVDH